VVARANDVSRPTMTAYAAKGRNTGAAVVVFPGGGYQFLAMDLEDTEICDWLTSRGITCVLLKYRVPGSGPWWDHENQRRVYPRVQTALQDAQRTLGLVRQHAAQPRRPVRSQTFATVFWGLIGVRTLSLFTWVSEGRSPKSGFAKNPRQSTRRRLITASRRPRTIDFGASRPIRAAVARTGSAPRPGGQTSSS
jgi:hypothetical protein